jgi:hypothetical protein
VEVFFYFRNIKDQEFKIKLRGTKFIKGKGLMQTYFLEGKGERGDKIPLMNPNDPEEEADELPKTGPDAIKAAAAAAEKKKGSKTCTVM